MTMLTERSPQGILNDLHWVINSPVLVEETGTGIQWLDDAFCQASYTRCQAVLKSLSVDDLCQLLPAPSSKRLGSYFEWLVGLWFSLDPAFDVLARNLPVRIQGRTWGELDLLVRHRGTDQCWHIELAIKFYLGLGGAGLNHWYGPGLKDRFDLKFDHMQWQQLQLTQRTEVQDWLSQQGLRVDQAYGLLKGRLFQPQRESRPEPVAWPYWVQSEACMSYWLPESRAADYLQQPRYLAKPEWLEGCDTQPREIARPLIQPVQVAAQREPVFIVPDDWEARASALFDAERAEQQAVYEAALYRIELAAEVIITSVGERWPIQHPAVAVVTAYNPGQLRPREEANMERNRRLEQVMSQAQWQWLPACGFSPDESHQEPSFAVLEPDLQRLKRILAGFGQRALFYLEPGQPGRLEWI